MKKEEIIKIWKEVILLVVKYNNSKTKKSKEDIIKTLDKYENNLEKDKTKYANIVLEFVIDIKNDLIAWRKLNIDNSNSDEYLENYFITQNEISIFNKLILKKEYYLLFEKEVKNYDKLFEDINNNFINNFKKLSYKNIAKNLLVFTLFNRIKPLDALYRMDVLFSSKLKNEKLVLKNRELINTYLSFIEQVYKAWIIYYKNGKYNYKFIKFSWDELDSITSDASKVNFRTWNPKFEYRELLKKLN